MVRASMLWEQMQPWLPPESEPGRASVDRTRRLLEHSDAIQEVAARVTHHKQRESRSETVLSGRSSPVLMDPHESRMVIMRNAARRDGLSITPTASNTSFRASSNTSLRAKLSKISLLKPHNH